MRRRHLAALAILLPCIVPAADGFPAPEARTPYALAKDHIPGIPSGPRDAEPTWISDAPPASWPVVDLNGTWKVSAQSDSACVDYNTIQHTYGPLRIADVLDATYAFPGWKDQPVPWPESMRPDAAGKPVEFRGVVYYHRQVTLPAYDSALQEPVLVFIGAGYRTDAWLGGRYLGHNNGMWSRFTFDLGAAARPGATLPLLVKCINTRFGYSYHARLSVGIFDPVRIEIRPKRALHDLRTRITPDGGALEATWTLPRAVAQGRGRLSAVLRPASGGAEVARVEMDADLRAPGFVRLPLAQPRWWSPEDPYLYRLTLSLDGVEVGTSRLGWRTIDIRTMEDGKQRFCLNGVPFWMRAFEFDYVWPVIKDASNLGLTGQREFGFNYQGRLRDALRVMKYANVNVFRPHAMHQFHNETLYNLCDELGFLVYLDWNGGGPQQVERGKDNTKGLDDLGGLESRDRNLPGFLATIAALHDHPSLAFISFGNEMYDHCIPTGMTWDGLVARYRAALQTADWQGRPGSGSTGRPVWEHTVPVDFVDHHQYIGVYYGTPADVPGYFEETTSAILKRFGARLPFVNMETGDVGDNRVHHSNITRMQAAAKADAPDKAKLIHTLTRTDAQASWARMAINTGGLRSYLTDLPAFRQRKGELMVKRYIELFRWQRHLTDGVSLNTAYYVVAGRSDPDYNGFTAKEYAIQPWPAGGELAIVDPLWDFRESFAPVQALADLANPHPLCGATTAAQVMVINDSQQPVEVNVLGRLRAADGATVDLPPLTGLTLAAGGFLRRGWTITVPETWKSGAASLEMAVQQGGKTLATNHYPLQLLAATDRRRSFPTKKLALYGPAASADGPSTAGMLDRLGIAYERITDLAQLSRFQVLVLAANGVDGPLQGSGAALHGWISAGGRLLAFEQSAAGGVPWADDERVMKLGRSTQMEIWYPKHPVFAGVGDYMAWHTPGGGDRSIFTTCLDLNDGFLAIAQAGHFEDPSSTKAVVSNRRLGSGEYLLSMVSTLPRYGNDAVVTRYVENCLAYILGDAIAPEAVVAKALGSRAGAGMSLDNKQAYYIDLRPMMNRGFEDETANDGQGGWTDYGRGSDMRVLPRNFHRFDNLLPFWVVPPEKNDGRSCIVLKGPTRDQFPESAGPVKVDARLEKLYVFHTTMYMKAKAGEPVLDYVITYADKTTATFEVRNGIDIGDWWMAKDLANAQVLHREGEKSIFCSEWVNPTPKVAISSLAVRSRGNAIPIIIAVTGRKIFEQKIDKTE